MKFSNLLGALPLSWSAAICKLFGIKREATLAERINRLLPAIKRDCFAEVQRRHPYVPAGSRVRCQVLARGPRDVLCIESGVSGPMDGDQKTERWFAYSESIESFETALDCYFWCMNVCNKAADRYVAWCMPSEAIPENGMLVDGKLRQRTVATEKIESEFGLPAGTLEPLARDMRVEENRPTRSLDRQPYDTQQWLRTLTRLGPPRPTGDEILDGCVMRAYESVCMIQKNLAQPKSEA